MNTFFFMALMTMAVYITKTFNPVKVVFTLMILSVLSLMWMFIQTGASWFPMIFFLMFMGGILIMFLILSSLLPNEKMWGTKMSYITMLMTMAAPIWWSPTKHGSANSGFSLTEAKTMMSEGANLIFMTTVVLLYFLIFVSMLSKENSPLRLPLCC